jgi:hypothetical protein
MCHHQSSCTQARAKLSLTLLASRGFTVFFLFLLACDRSYTYSPKGWTPQKEGLEWVLVEGLTKFRTWGIDKFLTSESIIPEFGITNQAATPLVVESAKLSTGRGDYIAKMPGRGALQWRTIPPGSIKRVPLEWTFEQPAYKVLGPNSIMDLRLRRGNQSSVLRVSYVRIE